MACNLSKKKVRGLVIFIFDNDGNIYLAKREIWWMNTAGYQSLDLV